MAAARFEKLEGFEGEERLRDIAKGVYFTKDGRFDPPKGKREAFERAMEFGASLEEAKTISGYMPEGKEIKYPTTKIAVGPKGERVFATEEDIATQGLRPEPKVSQVDKPGIIDEHDWLDIYAKDRQDAIQAKDQEKVASIDYKIQTLKAKLDKEGTKESIPDLVHRLRKVYTDEYLLSGGRLPTIGTGQNQRPAFEDWLVNQGIFYTSAYLGDNWRKDIDKILAAARREFDSIKDAEKAAADGIIKSGDAIIVAGVEGTWE